jgi:hypothetical protein
VSIDLDTKPRQRISISQHLSSEYGEIRPTVWPATEGQHIAAVEIVEGLRLQSDEPETLRAIADAFVKAALSIEALDGATWNAT